MECPKCGYEPTMAEQVASPDLCPSCGIVYKKFKAAEAVQSGDRWDEPGIGDRVASAKHAVAQGRQSRRDKERYELGLDSPVQRVRVVDLNMPFWSLVSFMVKAAFASIPAAIIVTIIVWIAVSLLGSI